MRVAICHDYLNQLGGAERVLTELLEIFPGADLFTLFHDPEKTEGKFAARITKASFLDHFFVRRRHRLFIPLFPIAAFFLRGEGEYDLLISSSAGYGKAFGVRARRHICYCHTPLRYGWEKEYISDFLAPFWPKPISKMHSGSLKRDFRLRHFASGSEYLGYSSPSSSRLAGKSRFSAPKPFLRWVLKPVLYFLCFPLRVWDFWTARRVDIFLANSEFIRDKIRRFYRREAQVVYPPVPEVGSVASGTTEADFDFYLAVGRLVPYKRFDLAILGARLAGRRLVMVGVGRDEARLQRMADGTVEFVGRISEARLRELYESARALIFPQVEDFGLVAAEAQMHGLPVVAYRAGGVLEIIKEGQTGVFFDRQTPEAVAEAIERFEARPFDRRFIRARALIRFPQARFRDTMRKYADRS